jgi:NAD(P)-dependent dehydrogenase (short-subunit alcohol dehydrogenase family)
MAFDEDVATGRAPMLGGKVAVISGVGSGMGHAALRLFSAAGATVIGAELHEATAQAAAEEVGVPVHVVDMTVADQVENLMDSVAREHGRIDVLYNNAGIGMIDENPGPLHETSDYIFDHTIEVNLRGTFLACRSAIPHMLAAGGSIVNVGSSYAIIAGPNSPSYCASKGAILSLTRSLAVDYAARGIRANALCPGFIDTAMVSLLISKQPDPKAAVDELHSVTPAGRLGSAEEVAATALWLSSDAASFVTGVSLSVDGGFTIM